MKRRIRLTEGDLRRIVNRSVRRVLNESNGIDTGQIIDKYYSNFNKALDLLKNVLELTKVDVHELEMMGEKDDVQYCFPTTVEAIKDAYGRLYNLVLSMDEYYGPTGAEYEDWHERNEHGDFDTY